MSNKILALLDKPGTLAEIAENGQRVAKAHHRVANRVETLLGMVDFCRLMN